MRNANASLRNAARAASWGTLGSLTGLLPVGPPRGATTLAGASSSLLLSRESNLSTSYTVSQSVPLVKQSRYISQLERYKHRLSATRSAHKLLNHKHLMP